MTQQKLDQKLFEVCTSLPVNYDAAEELLKQGANPLGAIMTNEGTDNLYNAVIDYYCGDECVSEDFYKITELFLRYGMDISKPTIPYDDDVLHPMWSFAFLHGEYALKTLKLLLDYGLSASDVAQCWSHTICDYVEVWGDLTNDTCLDGYYEYLHRILLIGSYPHILNTDDDLRKEIWADYNDYDLCKFREWNQYSFEIDTSYCKGSPQVYRSLVYVIEKSTDKIVWKFGVCLNPNDCKPGNKPPSRR